MAILQQNAARSRDYALLLLRMTSRVLYSAQYHRQHCTPHAFEQLGAMYMHNHDKNYLFWSGFDTNEPWGRASKPHGQAKEYTWLGT